MPIPSSINLGGLIEQAYAGSDLAALTVLHSCGGPLLIVVHANLSPRLRKLDASDDFLQDTFEGIFTTHFSRRVLSSSRRLWKHLKKIAENKVRDIIGRTFSRKVTTSLSTHRWWIKLRKHKRLRWSFHTLLSKELVEKNLG